MLAFPVSAMLSVCNDLLPDHCLPKFYPYFTAATQKLLYLKGQKINKPADGHEMPWSRATQDNGISVEVLFTLTERSIAGVCSGMLSVYTGTEGELRVWGTDSVSHASSLPQTKPHCQPPFSPGWFCWNYMPLVVLPYLVHSCLSLPSL